MCVGKPPVLSSMKIMLSVDLTVLNSAEPEVKVLDLFRLFLYLWSVYITVGSKTLFWSPCKSALAFPRARHLASPGHRRQSMGESSSIVVSHISDKFD